METWAEKVVVHLPRAGLSKYSLQTGKETWKKLVAHFYTPGPLPTLSQPELSSHLFYHVTPPTPGLWLNVASSGKPSKPQSGQGWGLCQFHLRSCRPYFVPDLKGHQATAVETCSIWAAAKGLTPQPSDSPRAPPQCLPTWVSSAMQLTRLSSGGQTVVTFLLSFSGAATYSSGTLRKSLDLSVSWLPHSTYLTGTL